MRFATLLLLAACTLQAQNSTQSGLFHVERPTLLNLGFEWAIEGDANRNATVEVRFRKVGAADWRPALPLLRIGGELVYRDQYKLRYTVPDGFAGSILNLEPATRKGGRFFYDGATVRLHVTCAFRASAGGLQSATEWPPAKEARRNASLVFSS